MFGIQIIENDFTAFKSNLVSSRFLEIGDIFYKHKHEI